MIKMNWLQWLGNGILALVLVSGLLGYWDFERYIWLALGVTVIGCFLAAWGTVKKQREENDEVS